MPNIIECPICDAKYDVSTVKTGAKLRCAKCKKVIGTIVDGNLLPIFETIKPAAGTNIGNSLASETVLIQPQAPAKKPAEQITEESIQKQPLVKPKDEKPIQAAQIEAIEKKINPASETVQVKPEAIVQKPAEKVSEELIFKSPARPADDKEAVQTPHSETVHMAAKPVPETMILGYQPKPPEKLPADEKEGAVARSDKLDSDIFARQVIQPGQDENPNKTAVALEEAPKNKFVEAADKKEKPGLLLILAGLAALAMLAVLIYVLYSIYHPQYASKMSLKTSDRNSLLESFKKS